MGFKFRKLTFLQRKFKKMHANLNKYKLNNCPALLERNSISRCNCRVKSVPAGQVEISSRQTWII